MPSELEWLEQQRKRVAASHAAAIIRALAAKHNVSYVETTLDVWANKITELCGDDVQLGEIELILVALQRAGHMTGREATQLQAEYLRERSQ